MFDLTRFRWLLMGSLVVLLFAQCNRHGCTNPTAENYDSDATIDDFSCEFIPGCRDALASNYDPNATAEAPCTFDSLTVWIYLGNSVPARYEILASVLIGTRTHEVVIGSLSNPPDSVPDCNGPMMDNVLVTRLINGKAYSFLAREILGIEDDEYRASVTFNQPAGGCEVVRL